MHADVIRVLLGRAKLAPEQGQARVVLVLPPLNVAALLRRNGSVLSGRTRRLLATLRHGDFLRRLQTEVDKLDNVILFTDQANEDLTTRCCPWCGTHADIGGARVKTCHNPACLACNVVVGRDATSAIAIRWRWCHSDLDLDAQPPQVCSHVSALVAPSPRTCR